MAEQGAILIKRGDTISGLSARIYKVPAWKTRAYWGEFFRKDKASGKLVPLADPNKIYAGETIYHRPDLANGKAAAATVQPATTSTTTTASPSKPISQWSRDDKVFEAIQRSYPHLDDHTVEILKAMVTPEAIGIAVGILVLWAASHFVGVGEIADVILLVIGAVAIGFSVFTAAEHLYKFADKSLNAETEEDLDEAGFHFSKAVTILGVETVSAILFKAKPKGTLKTNYLPKPVNVKNPPPTQGLFYKPKTVGDPHRKAATGSTNQWGDIKYSTAGTAADQKLALLHERVHQILTPKFQYLRQIRVKLAMEGYNKSYLLRYLEEALAEAVGQLGANGFRQAFQGVTFPVANGYVTVGKMASEAAGILLGPINVGGEVYRAWFKEET